MTKREFLDIVFALAPTEANTIMDAFDEYVESAQLSTNLAEVGTDCISRQAAIEAMAELQGSTSSKGVLKGISKAWKRIEQLPPIQPRREERKIGEWIYDWGDWDFETCKCSECGNHITTPIGKRYSFCPNCGADMREVTT